MLDINHTGDTPDLFESVIGAIDVGLLVFDAKDRLILANPWVRKLFPSLENAITENADSAEIAILLSQQVGNPLEGTDFKVGDRWLRSRQRNAPDDATIVVLTDITSEKRAESLLVDARDNAVLADRAKSEFLANMTHELRTPLNAVIGFAEVLRDELYGPLGHPQYQDFVADIYESGRHLLAVIDDILDLSKIEIGRRELRPHPMDITRTIDTAVRMLVHRANTGGVTVEASYRDDLPLLNGEERGIKQIVLNLLTNSIKFTPHDGHVVISAKVNDGLDISVKDTGVGIAEDDLSRVFTPFVQLDAGGMQRYEGAGLGLALVKSLAEMHDATVHIDSTVGEGTTVTVHFPADSVTKRMDRS